VSLGRKTTTAVVIHTDRKHLRLFDNAVQYSSRTFVIISPLSAILLSGRSYATCKTLRNLVAKTPALEYVLMLAALERTYHIRLGPALSTTNFARPW
jgi:hypothetical protein